MSSATAVVILIVVLVVAGLGSFFVFNAQVPTKTCVPATAPGCVVSNIHDVTVVAPFTTTQTAQPIPFTVTLPETSGHYEINFGDGTNASSTTATFTHTYKFAGTYIVSAKALVGSTWHDNLHALLVVTINPSFTSDINGTLPSIRGTLISNSTSTTAPTGVLATGGTLTVEGVNTLNASSAGWVYIPPTITASCGTSCIKTTPVTVSGLPGVSASVTFTSPGIYTVSYNTGSELGTSGPQLAQDYVWTAYVSSPSGISVGTASYKSPHPGTLIIYHNYPGGAETLDPSIDYETVGYEVIESVYQTLISYNGSASGPSPSEFVPVIAACVPGTTACTSLFGSTLQSGPYYTFVISSAPHFYDPAAPPGTSWGVWPSDVVFSEARAMSLANPIGDFPGWIQAQSLIAAPSNSSWDSSYHAPFNNTPYNILHSMTINGSACPSIATTSSLYHGCVTFNASGWGAYNKGPLGWSNFLDYMTIQSSGAILSCGWETANGAGLPGFATVTGAGDSPCKLSSNVTNIGTSANPSIANTAWDFMLTDFLITEPPCGDATVSCGHMVGTGPYYLSSYVVATSYGLKANPNYEANPNCSWTYVQGVEACYPQPGAYASSVDVTWESDPSLTAGLQGMEAGVVDFADYHGSTQTALALQFVAQHKATLTIGSTLAIDFWPFNLDFNLTAAAAYPTGPITVPEDFFSYVGVRQLFSTAYAYTTVQSTLNTVDGIQYQFDYGGVIPHFMSDYYPANISWPNADPVSSYTSTLSPSYWWAALTTPTFAGGQYYDPELASCKSSSPCQVPLFLQTGAPNLDQSGALLAQNLLTYTNGSIVMHTLDINFVQLVINSLYTGAYQSPMPFYRLGWAPDYAAPDDYWIPLYYPNSTYTDSDTVWPALNVAGFTMSDCSQNFQTYISAVNNSCEGTAYDLMQQLFIQTYLTSNHTYQLLLYNMAEHIAKNLALYIYTFQDNNVWMEAPWINGASIDQNVVLSGALDIAYFWIDYQGGVPA